MAQLRLIKLTSLLSLLTRPVPVRPGFSPDSDNIAVYWGQNSYGQRDSQQRLSYYCANTQINVIALAFLNIIVSPTTVNFANAGDNCTAFSDSALLECPQIEEDISVCQSVHNTTVLLSIGGSTYTEGGFESPSAAEAAADRMWAMFGPVDAGSAVDRPFGSAVVDGFDFDLESTTRNTAPFARRLRSLMDAAGEKRYYLSAAPQCPYPDEADDDMLAGAVGFDFVMVQFYNNPCGVQSFVAGAPAQDAFDFSTWHQWARSVSLNGGVRVLLGIPANAGAGAGYVSGSDLAPVISYCKQYSSFGGVMMWDMSQLYANPGFLDAVAADLSAGPATSAAPATSVAPTTSAAPAAPATSAGPATPTAPAITGTAGAAASAADRGNASYVLPSISSAALVPQWGQCGGIGYDGPTRCRRPYTCVANSEWWSQCE